MKEKGQQKSKKGNVDNPLAFLLANVYLRSSL
jgi:hypothetical protein